MPVSGRRCRDVVDRVRLVAAAAAAAAAVTVTAAVVIPVPSMFIVAL